MKNKLAIVYRKRIPNEEMRIKVVPGHLLKVFKGKVSNYPTRSINMDYIFDNQIKDFKLKRFMFAELKGNK